MTGAARWAAIAVAFAVAPTSSRVMAGLPDWAKPVVEAAPPVPEGVPDWPARTLLADTAIVVSQDGATWRIEDHRVIQVLSARVDELQYGLFPFDDTMKIKKSKGWQMLPGEYAHRNFGGAIDVTLSDSFLTDAKVRAVALDGVKKGSLLVYEFQAEGHPYTLTEVESFFQGVPVSVARWSIALPPRWTLKYKWLPSGPEPTQVGTTWVFEQRDLVPAHEEALDEAPAVLAPYLTVALQPPAGVATPTPAFSDWGAAGRWYQELAKGRETATPEIETATQAVLAKAGPAPLDRIRAVTRLVRDRVRYVAREVGVGGYQPHPASQVFAESYGDCKDKGTLLRAALQSAGFRSYPMLVNATNPYTVAPDVPTPGSFDHFVVGVVWPSDAPFPDEAASARVDAGDAGTLIVIDPTDPYAWPGTLPDHLAGKTGLAVAGGQGVLITLPDGQPKWNRIARKAAAALAPDRSVALTLVSRMYGGPAEEARRANADSFKDRRRHVEDQLRTAWAGCDVKDYSVIPEDTDGAYVETVSILLPATAAALQENVYWMFSGATLDIDRVPLGKRKVAVQYPHPFELSYEATVTGAAKDHALPDPLRLSGAAWAVETAYHRDGEAISGSWKAELTGTHFEPAAFPDLKQFWSAASKAAGAGLALAR